jgi:hypothetical protein
VWPHGATAKISSATASQAKLSGPFFDDEPLAPRESPSAAGTKGEDKATGPAGALAVTTKRAAAKTKRLSVEDLRDAEIASQRIAEIKSDPTALVSGDDLLLKLATADAAATKIARKAYLREYMRKRRASEREAKLKAAEAGKGVTDT